MYRPWRAKGWGKHTDHASVQLTSTLSHNKPSQECHTDNTMPGNAAYEKGKHYKVW